MSLLRYYIYSQTIFSAFLSIDVFYLGDVYPAITLPGCKVPFIFDVEILYRFHIISLLNLDNMALKEVKSLEELDSKTVGQGNQVQPVIIT